MLRDDDEVGAKTLHSGMVTEEYSEMKKVFELVKV